jgi:recombination protein RecR
LETYPSKLLEEAVNEFTSLPGVGKRTALRFVLHLLKQDKNKVNYFSNVISKLRNEINYCRNCYNICEGEICNICADPRRDQTIICVVEDIRDVMAIENTGQYKGVYHVTGGIISPMDGIGPSQLNIEALIEKCRGEKVSEIIMALPASMEGDTTAFYISKHFKEMPLLITTLSRGVAVGADLEYTDEATLARSIVNRVPYK